MDWKRKLYEEMNGHLMEDARPSAYLAALDDAVLCTEYPFTMLGRLKDTGQSPVHHPEGSVWNHTLLVVDEAAKRKARSSDARVLMWAALLHDTGKPGTTKNRGGKITSYNHDREGEKLSGEFLAQFGESGAFIAKVAALVRFHMQILYVVKSLPFADIGGMKQCVPVWDVALLGLCDRLGRKDPDRKTEEENIRVFLARCGEKDIFLRE